jgi:hypothetical protein
MSARSNIAYGMSVVALGLTGVLTVPQRASADDVDCNAICVDECPSDKVLFCQSFSCPTTNDTCTNFGSCFHATVSCSSKPVE